MEPMPMDSSIIPTEKRSPLISSILFSRTRYIGRKAPANSSSFSFLSITQRAMSMPSRITLLRLLSLDKVKEYVVGLCHTLFIGDIVQQLHSDDGHKSARNSMTSTVHHRHKKLVIHFIHPVKIATHNILWFV